MRGFDHALLYEQQQRQATAFARRDKKSAGRFLTLIVLRLDDRILQQPVRFDTGGERLDFCFCMRDTARIVWRFLQLIERDQLYRGLLRIVLRSVFHMRLPFPASIGSGIRRQNER
jgi:hypothetical protein